MKTLLLMRHAKSSWKDTKLKDRDRPLNKRGKRVAPQMGELIKDKELVPQLILCSTALRARETAQALLSKIDFQGKIEYMDKLYMAEADDCVRILRHQDDELERILLIGHNPGLESLIPMLTGRIEALPTGAIAHLALPVSSWKELKHDVDGELVELWRPKELEI
jgi:phosphohistidine phosphatase